MARPLRIEYPGALYHVTTGGNAGGRIFRSDKDRVHSKWGQVLKYKN
jgi:hypothetical protein